MAAALPGKAVEIVAGQRRHCLFLLEILRLSFFSWRLYVFQKISISLFLLGTSRFQNIF
jgi:hypothetical protein